MARDRESSDASSGQQASAQPNKRPNYHRHNTSDSTVSQISDHYRSKHQKHVVGGGGRHARNPSKGLHNKHHASQQSSARLNRKPVSPSHSPERAPMVAPQHHHRRATSDVKLPTGTESANPNLALKKNASHSSLASAKRNKSHVDIGKRAKSTANIKRSSSHKDVQKLKGHKSQVHFDLGAADDNDENAQEDEWVDASASASPYLSRRGSVVSSAKTHSAETSRPHTPEDQRPKTAPPTNDRQHTPSPNRETAQHNSYITSRLLQRTPSQGAPPQMSAETASGVPHRSGSPDSQTSRGPPSLYGTPKTPAIVGSGQAELTSRFVNGVGSGPSASADPSSYFTTPKRSAERRSSDGVRRPHSLGDLNHEHRSSISENENEDEDSALAPRTTRRGGPYRANPAAQSRTQQKLNLQRASSTIEPAGVDASNANPLISNVDVYGQRGDPRIAKLLERAGMEYLVVRRYQNPIARSLNRLAQLPTHRNGSVRSTNGVHGKKPSDATGGGKFPLSHSMVDIGMLRGSVASRPSTPRRSASSAKTNSAAASSHFETVDEDRMSGASNAELEDENITAILRNLWDKNERVVGRG
ncbi:hypothetical protein F4780DRAFT_267882 [Xylariomycetidae sp. FL0641]|nr:hypothetical protein F4780DRAFT_267882 [Xylariomycetidae sp. FL0641]